MSYRAIVFDLAGVLLDCEEAHESAARKLAAQLELEVPDSWWPRIRGGVYESFFEQVLSLPANGARCLRLVQVALQAYEHYYEEVRRSARLLPGAIEILETSRSRFRFVALATSSEWRLAEAALKHFGLTGYFDAIVSGDHTTQKKPAPEAFLVTAWLLGVHPKAMVVVEDSVHGVRAARMARAHVIGVATSRSPEALAAASAHHVVRDLADLATYISGLARSGAIADPAG